MRPLAAVACLALVSLAGCIGADDDLTVDSDDVGFDDAHLMVMPERRFEPELVLDTEFFELEQGEILELWFNITDLHDYEYPLSFIDWNITYNREPNPVAKGEAPDLPATWSRTLYAEDWHTFTFTANDGQGFKDSVTIIVQVGDPVIEEVVEEVAAPLGDVYIHQVSYAAPLDCEECVDASTDAWGVEATGYPGALGCSGFLIGANYLDCAWVNISPDAWGHPFTVSSTLRADDPPDPSGILNRKAGDPGSVDVEFWESCGVESPGPDLSGFDPDDPAGTAPTDYDPTAYSEGSLGWEFIDTDTDVVEGIIPEGAGCLVAFDFAWPTTEGVMFHFEWTEDFSGKFEYAYNGIPMIVPQDADGAPAPCQGELADCGPSTCPGLPIGWNGYGCAWMEVTPNMWDFEFSQLGASDADGYALTECSPEAEKLGSYGAIGPESGIVWLGRTIPEGAGCLYFYEYAGWSGIMIIEVLELY